ncbi:MAG: bifunctional oligoribonuclease/PAP phosphatase NrnA [Ignavibacteriae bacterium HGW-Ignavibacteriae-2]|jgi:phosphoesterase RecJ-like protein|nr:MAG: bifunctional oligoribonuclease/PAP phosphatase NrnA [Ignavibacteriae bacterium HGW-Ignavibacteriae-2]
MISFDQIHALIQNNNSFLITTHVNPDGDAIGSELALYHYLKRIGKEAAIFNCSQTPYNLEFLDPTGIISHFDKVKNSDIFDKFDVLVLLDLNHLSRIMELEEGFRKSTKLKICIDHHDEPENFSEYMFVDINYASTGEIIFELIEAGAPVKIDYQIALPLYIAIMTDTGSFRYERTTSATHIKAAKLLDAGVDPNTAASMIHDQGSPGRMRLLGRALDSIKLYYSNQLCTMALLRKDLTETGTVEADIEGFVNYTLSIKGVRAGLLFYELENGFKVSFRSVDNVQINKLAKEFNGGGHFYAAGTRISNAKLGDYYDTIIKAAEKYL